MSLSGAIKNLLDEGSPEFPTGNHGEPLQAALIKEVPLVPLVPLEKSKSENEFAGTVKPTNAATDLPPPWDAIRDRIQAGWRAEFAAPGADGQQAITWIQPGAWEPSELRRNEPTPTARPLAECGMVTCGACRNWTAPPGDGAGRCGQGVKPSVAQGPLCRNAPRYCTAFKPITGKRRA